MVYEYRTQPHDIIGHSFSFTNRKKALAFTEKGPYIQSMTTKHTCGGPVFGRKTAGCPRCDELLAGAPVVKWKGETAKQKQAREASFREAVRAHYAAGKNGQCPCGPVCTKFDW